MTRKKAIEIVIETAKKCSWVPSKWKTCSVHGVQKSGWGRAYAVGFFCKIACDILRDIGITKRPEGGYNFTREWLEKNGHLK